jgi:sporulation protein YlmC with PRC-barrel domain
MEIEYGAEVIDRNGKALGTVDYLIRNSWTGEISKFMVRRKPPNKDLFFSLQDVLEVAEPKIRVTISLDELSSNTQVVRGSSE